MYQSLRPLYAWVAKSWVGLMVSDSTWMFPAVEAVHIVALTVLLGAVIMLDMRLLGVTMKSRPMREVYRDLAPWTLLSLIIILTSGFLLFASEALKAYDSAPFQVKMILLATAILFHYTVYRRVANADEGSIHPVLGKSTAAVSLVLWFGVGMAGRAIGFF